MDVIVDTVDGTASIIIDRPAKRNAITVAMYAAMADAIEAASADASVRVVTIAANGGLFTAGNDIGDFMSVRGDDPDMPVFRFLRAISTCPKVVVAAVAGLAVGIGTTMLLHCDLVLATADARFSLPFVDLGLVPEAASSLLLPRLIGRQRAALHLILGDPFDAKTALGYGLVTEIVDGDPRERLAAITKRIAEKPPEAVAITKRLLARTDGDVATRMAEEGALFGERLRSAEAVEAFTAFFEKRAPDFTRR